MMIVNCQYSGYDCNGGCISDTDGDGICNPFEIPGCMDVNACNYEDAATDNDGSCDYGVDYNENAICDDYEDLGCMNELACNYDEDALNDDGSCEFLS